MKPGQPWAEPWTGPPDHEVAGPDAALAALATRHPGALIRFRPSRASDLARAVGLDAGAEPNQLAVPMDAMQLESAARLPSPVAVNAVVVGRRPTTRSFIAAKAAVRVTVDGRRVAEGPATTVVIANGQFLDGLDVVPRGHPGDGRIEVQVYALGRSEWRKMQARLPQGAHLPHPRIATGSGREVQVQVDGGRLAVRVDGVLGEPVDQLTVRVVPNAFRLLI